MLFMAGSSVLKVIILYFFAESRVATYDIIAALALRAAPDV